MPAAINSVQHFLQQTGTNGAVQRIAGPFAFFEYVGSVLGADLEFSLDGSSFIPMSPGDRFQFATPSSEIYIRNRLAVDETFTVRYGDSRYFANKSPVRSTDGRHPVGRSYVSTAAAVAPLALFPFASALSGDTKIWRPHLKDLVAFNAGAAAAYVKIARGTALGAPTVGVDRPIFCLALPAVGHAILNTTHGIRGVDGLSGAAASDLFYWFSGGAAWNDATAVAADQIMMTCNFS